MDIIEIRQVNLADLTQLRSISMQTFIESFAHLNTADNMQKYLEDNLSIEKLTSELNDSNSEFYFALLNNKVIGYLKVNHAQAQTELHDKNSIEIERIYVLKEFQDRKIGQVLFDKAMSIAHEKNAEFVWLGVWEKNIRAINFYKKNGFIEFDKHIFKLGNDEQTDIMMRLMLN